MSVKAYWTLKRCKAVYNTMRKDFTALESYHDVSLSVFQCDNHQLNSKNKTFMLQSCWFANAKVDNVQLLFPLCRHLASLKLMTGLHIFMQWWCLSECGWIQNQRNLPLPKWILSFQTPNSDVNNWYLGYCRYYISWHHFIWDAFRINI